MKNNDLTRDKTPKQMHFQLGLNVNNVPNLLYLIGKMCNRLMFFHNKNNNQSEAEVEDSRRQKVIK